MSPSPLSLGTVHTALQYIAPPSQLDQPLPPFLLSRPLLQRHHFLSISTDDPVQYLCWPSETSTRAVDLLENLPRPVDDDALRTYSVRYTSDTEHTYAHVALHAPGEADAVRLVFQWDELDGWKFHDTKLMPFPKECKTELSEVSSFQASLSSSPQSDAVAPAYNPYRFSDQSDDESDDDYWNAYGASDADGPSAMNALASSKDADDGEDAYWARYATVQGTADSTIPSPPIQRRRPDPYADPSHDTHAVESPYALPVPACVDSEVLQIPPSLMRQERPTGSRMSDPASPKALARLLAEISPRHSLAVLDDFEDIEAPALESDTSDAATSSDDALGLITSAEESPVVHEALGATTKEFGAALERDEEDEALRQSLKGLYTLWKQSRNGRGASFGHGSRASFLRIVQDVPSRKFCCEDLGCVLADMDDPEDGSTTGEYEQWERLLNEQTGLFRRTTARNKELEARVEELEREVAVWKIAHKAVEDEKNASNKQVSRLERSIGSLKEDSPLILCLIDGDGNIFSPQLIRDGLAGGRRAAKVLTQGLTEHMASLDPGHGGSAGRGEIWLTIYCNKKGLTEALTANDLCTAEQFDQFVMGFNQATPLFSFVDVGVGKEAADSKIKEFLRVFTRFPQTSRVFFGGAHDNGYTSALNYLANEGLHHKLTILRGYREFAFEVKSLNLPFLDIPGLFMTERLQTINYKRQQNVHTGNIQPVQVQDFDKFRNRPSPALQTQGVPGSPGKKAENGRMPIPGLPLHKHRPPPCNFFYLMHCKHGNKCRYAHDYILDEKHVMELRENAKKWPCPDLNRDKPCLLGIVCPMAHQCPNGAKCIYAKTGKCKFSKPMHVGAADSTQASTPVRSPSPASTTNPYIETSSTPDDSAYDDVFMPFFGAPPGLSKPQKPPQKSRSHSP
ncbi:uncharacterized protein PHACADRAFT_168384 [Phanerochaete carnosa HHB-10118-sp]|uniref:C3H1-type domain-containing protein n=1 Tax=Phanerochaete carnosa (strain HHB-10118-sp) TaxID=650164 RepID=K5VDG4_PHACS|nr:uncharacterized protein PHACADRAFT_168384 [Phanerochaete carnosa HHB-10118-sp]EKM61021.1 hypothetical protein PHACADRAFT_168384 [Phanerochaete carnosa HHB-10118-sp]